ncbi:MAG: TonB-dependent receptor [Deltaproteobacteria bacterium]|nr:TonB-dependent receptor [Deltaproteobacteria bacterium]
MNEGPANMRQINPCIVFFVILLWILLFGMGSGVRAAEDNLADGRPGVQTNQPDGVYLLEPIVVTATREETRRQDVAANIAVITRDEIEKIPAASAAEVLQYVPGVYVEFNGGPGSNSTARIQGAEVRHTAVFMDGIPLNQLANPLTDLSYIPVDIIERIEVYKGAASSAWGSSLGGVINIITVTPDTTKPLSADFRTSYGKNRTSKNRGNISGTLDRLGYFFSLTHDRSDGFSPNSAYHQNALYAKIDHDLGLNSVLNLVYSFDEGGNKDPAIGHPDFWDDIRQKRSYQSVRIKTEPTPGLLLVMEGRHHKNDSRIDDVYTDHREVFNDYTEETWGFSGRVRYAVHKNSLNVGFDGDWGRYDWNNYIKTYHTGNWAFYINDTLNYGRFTFNTGLRNDYNRYFGSEFSPSAGWVCRLFNEKALLRAQVARGFSAPPAAWVNDPVYGNPDLKPETALNYQVGGEAWIMECLHFELNAFQANVKDLIRYDLVDPDHPDDPHAWKLINLDQVTRRGVEGIISATFASGVFITASGSFTDVKDDLTNQVIKDIPRLEYSLSATVPYKWSSQTLTGKYINNNSTYPETRDKVFIFDYQLKITPPDLHPFGSPEIFCAVHNLFNTNYVYRNVWPQPDRWMEAGLRFTL